ncbi:hypothetical protein AAMO2058_001418000 [Amorphochlora amoebiformis]
MGPHVPPRATQSWVVQTNQHQLSPMHVVEPAHAGGSTYIPRVNATPLGSVIPYTGVSGQIPIVHERREIPGIYPNHTNVLHHANPNASNATNLRHTRGPFANGLSGTPFVSTHVPDTGNCVNGAPQGIASAPSGFKRVTSLETKTEEIQASKKKKRRTGPKQKMISSICQWCGCEYKSSFPRHMEKCEDGLFGAACYAIRTMFGRSSKVNRADVKKAYIEVMKSSEMKSELIRCIKERMVNRIKGKIEHKIRAPRNGPGFKSFEGLDAMVHIFFWLFGLRMPETSVAAGLESYNFTGFDADISTKVKVFILRWIEMTRKTARRDGLNAIGHTSQDSLPNGDCKVVLDMSPEEWNKLEDTEYNFLHDKSDVLKDIASLVKQFELRLLGSAPTEKFAWLRCFLVTLRGFSVEALKLKTLPNGIVYYRTLQFGEGKGVLASMSTFVMQNYYKLVESSRDVVSSQDHATELRLQLLRAILAIPSDRRAYHLITLAEELVRRLSEDVPHQFSRQFGDVPQITYPYYPIGDKALSIAESVQKDLCHLVHVQGSRSSRMCRGRISVLRPISGQNNLHSTALDLFINRGLNFKAEFPIPAYHIE